MGVSADADGGLTLACGGSIIRYRDVLKPEERINHVFDACFMPRTIYVTGELDAHDVGVDGALDPLAHSLRNRLIVQAAGVTQLRVLPASEAGRLYECADGASEIPDLDDPALDRVRFPRLDGARCYGVRLEAGEALFLPMGWWCQARSEGFCAKVTYTVSAGASARLRWRRAVAGCPLAELPRSAEAVWVVSLIAHAPPPRSS